MFPAVTLRIDLTVNVFEENPETSSSEWGEVLRQIKNVQGKRSSDHNWMVVEKGRGSEFFRFFADVINERAYCVQKHL